MGKNYGLDELFRDLTGVGASAPTPAPKAAPKKPTQPTQPRAAPTPAPRPAPSATPTPAKGSTRSNAYDTVLGYGRYGSPGKPLTQMTVGEAVAFGRNVLIPNSRRAGVGRDSRGLVGSSAMGAYQITQETLQRYGPGVLGARWRMQPFTSENQDKLAQAIFEDSKGGNLQKVWAGLPDSRPGAYANTSWNEMKAIIQQREGTSSRTGNRQMANGQGSGTGVTPTANYERWLESAIPAEVAASGGVGLPAGAAETISGAPAKIGERQAGLDQALGDMGQRIDVLDQATQAAQATQVTQRTQQVEDSRRVNQEVVAGTDELRRKVAPVMEARTRIADQLDQVATMNPLERSLRSIFDLNYDSNHLSGQLERFDKTLQARMYDYEYLDTLQQVSLREIDRRYGIETSLTDLDVQQGTEDLALVNQRLGLASQMLGSSRDELATQSQLIVAQAQGREAVLSRLDTPTVMGLMTQAQAAGGVVTHEGLEFSYKELRDKAELGEQQQRSIRSNQLALAQGEMGLAEGIAMDLTRSLTREQLEEAAANGGVWNGVQLPQDAITAAISGHRERATGQAQDILNRMPEQIALQTTTAALNSVTSLYYRSKNMMSPADLQNSSVQLRNFSDLNRQIIEATQSGAPAETIQALIIKLGQAQQTYQQTVGTSILRSVGGDKKAAGYVESFVYGSPLNPGTAAEALTYFALKGGLPDGLAVSPEARQVFIRAQQIANANRTQGGKAISFDRLNQIVQSEIGEYAAQIIGTPRLNDVMSSLPAHAKAVGHPLGRMRQEWWRTTYSEASAYANQELANLLNTTPQNVGRMMERMASVDSTPASEKLFKDFLAQAGQYNAIEQRYILERLDSVEPFQPGRSNSELFEELLYSPELHQRINKTTETIEGNSFGDFLMGPLAQGAGQQALIDYARDVENSASASRISAQTAARESNRVWGSNGQVRIMSIISQIPSIGDNGADKLRPFIQQTLASMPRPSAAMSPFPAAQAATDQGRGMMEEVQVLEAFRTTKFDDPSMEAYRKAAIQHWTEYSSLGDNFMQNFQREARR